MSPAERFTTWRAEIAIEIEATQGELATERNKLAAAEEIHAAAKEDFLTLDAFADGALRNPSEGIASALALRLRQSRESLDKATAARGAARAAVSNLEKRVSELVEAISQIDHALTTAKVSTLRPAPDSSRRKPRVVDFDNIQMPR